MLYVPSSRSHLARQLRRAAAVLAFAAGAVPAQAGQASAGFAITIEVVPQGSSACTTSAGDASAQVTCRPTVIGPGTPTTVVGGSIERQAGSAVLGYRLPDSAIKLAGEMIEVGEENHYAWTDNNYFAWGEYSSRVITAGGREYVEMTVTW